MLILDTPISTVIDTITAFTDLKDIKVHEFSPVGNIMLVFRLYKFEGRNTASYICPCLQITVLLMLSEMLSNQFIQVQSIFFWMYFNRVFPL